MTATLPPRPPAKRTARPMPPGGRVDRSTRPVTDLPMDDSFQPLDAADELRLSRQYHRGRTRSARIAARNEMIQRVQPLITKLARRYHQRHNLPMADVDDSIAAANVTLLDRYDFFVAGRYRFTTFTRLVSLQAFATNQGVERKSRPRKNPTPQTVRLIDSLASSLLSREPPVGEPDELDEMETFRQQLYQRFCRNWRPRYARIAELLVIEGMPIGEIVAQEGISRAEVLKVRRSVREWMAFMRFELALGGDASEEAEAEWIDQLLGP